MDAQLQAENRRGLRNLKAENERLLQFKEWADPQIVQHGADRLEIEGLRGVISEHQRLRYMCEQENERLLAALMKIMHGSECGKPLSREDLMRMAGHAALGSPVAGSGESVMKAIGGHAVCITCDAHCVVIEDLLAENAELTEANREYALANEKVRCGWYQQTIRELQKKLASHDAGDSNA
jgi:hypothetical protein